MRLLVGPAASGKTTRLLGLAHAALGDGRRVWWIGLPSQRTDIYRRITRTGPVLGFEFLSSQHMYYRMLTKSHVLHPPLPSTARLALVGEALRDVHGHLPNPGEARLFTHAIAEAKRNRVAPHDIPGDDRETRRLRDVYATYERLRGDRWDYDDFRNAALERAEAGEADLDADLLLIDGFREISPTDLRIARALGSGRTVWLTSPRPVVGVPADETLPERPLPTQVYRSANPVAETRWVLRSLKRDLANGIDPLDLALIIPPGYHAAVTTLAEEYGVPVMDEHPRSLADTPAGRRLLDLVELPDAPTATKLLAHPDLERLGQAALERRVAGRAALEELAAELGLSEPWRRALDELEPTRDAFEWARRLVVERLPELQGEPVDRAFASEALQRAKEAAALGVGRDFCAWWATLLRDCASFERPRGGVALLDADLASGRRFVRAYVLGAVEGAYGGRESEDYFVPEEARRPLEDLLQGARLSLPRRFAGRERAALEEVFRRGATTVVTYPEADQGGVLVPEPAVLRLAGGRPPPLPRVAPGSAHELPSDRTFVPPPFASLGLGTPSIHALRAYAQCGFRYWLNRRLPNDAASSADEAWRALRRDLRDCGSLDDPRLRELCERHAFAALWLRERADFLRRLRFGHTVTDAAGVRGRVDAALDGDETHLYRFVEPDFAARAQDPRRLLEDDWIELWAAGALLSRPTRPRLVRIFVWPLNGEPVEAFDGGVRSVWKGIRRRQIEAREAQERFLAGDVEPRPGFHCRDCSAGDVCRVKA